MWFLTFGRKSPAKKYQSDFCIFGTAKIVNGKLQFLLPQIVEIFNEIFESLNVKLETKLKISIGHKF